MIAADIINKLLSGNAKDYSITIYDCVNSTNTMLRESAEKGEHVNTVVIAEEQTTGKGRNNRSFFSPPGSGLYISILLRPKLSAEKAFFITTSAAVAVCRAIELSTSKCPYIKWVNDIIIDDKKVCGILTEASIENGMIKYAILGIGINVFEPHCGFPDSIRDVAGAVCSNYIEGLREKIAAEFLNSFSEYTDYSETSREYKNRSLVIGKIISVFNIATGESYNALVKDIDNNCHLLIIDEHGDEKSLNSGEISIRIK